MTKELPEQTGLILIVDDIPANLDVLSETLSIVGYDVAIATTGKRALKQVERKPPDLILLDITMPDMDGFEICEKLKDNPITRNIPIIFITALADTESKVKGFELGAVDYITKPFQEKEVLARVKTHLQLRKLTQNLEQEVAIKVISLEQAKQAAEAANMAKSLFLANISHELRTPLNAVLGLTEALEEEIFGSVNDEQIKALQTIYSSGNHLLELINDILDITKIESGRLQLNCEPTAVVELCQSSLAVIKQIAANKRIQLEMKLPPNLPELIVDELRIRQVLINLLNNAVKFTPDEGSVTLEVKLNQQEQTNSETVDSPKFLQIAIQDTGIGIAPENLDKLFQPFVQIDNSLNRRYEGTGLGLALVKRIVNLHGGEVGVTSKLGVGSCFTIDLPYDANIPLFFEVENQLEPSINIESSQIQENISPLILLVEDNETNITTVSSYLKAKNYQIILAKNGEEAVTLAKSQNPDLIMIDISIPKINGIEAIQQIRLVPNLVDIPIIALTALAMTGEQELCLSGGGANKYLSKPVKLKQLSTTIQHLLTIKENSQ